MQYGEQSVPKVRVYFEKVLGGFKPEPVIENWFPFEEWYEFLVACLLILFYIALMNAKSYAPWTWGPGRDCAAWTKASWHCEKRGSCRFFQVLSSLRPVIGLFVLTLHRKSRRMTYTWSLQLTHGMVISWWGQEKLFVQNFDLHHCSSKRSLPRYRDLLSSSVALICTPIKVVSDMPIYRPTMI